MTSPDAGHRTRSLSYGWFAVIVIAYLAIIKGVGYIAGQVWDTDDGLYTTRDVIVQMWVPLGAALLFTYAVVAVLRWWDPVLRERHPVQRWVWAVPIVFAVCIAAAIDYADLFDKSIGYILALLVATQFVGWGEEGMFRGIGVTTLRAHGLTEGRVALWSSVVFGTVHISNALTGDVSKALPQAMAVSFAGYFFYLIRRSRRQRAQLRHPRALRLLDSDRHGHRHRPGRLHRFAAAIVAYLVVGALLIVRRHRIEPGRPNPHRTDGDHRPKKALPAEVSPDSAAQRRARPTATPRQMHRPPAGLGACPRRTNKSSPPETPSHPLQNIGSHRGQC